MNCENHSDSAADKECSKCFESFCSKCVKKYGYSYICKHCSKVQKIRLLIFSALIVIIPAAIYFGNLLVANYQHNQIAKDIISNNCSAKKTYALIKSHMKNDDYIKTIDIAKVFLDKCGEQYDIRTSKLYAHKQMMQWDLALEDTNALINKYPNDKDFWWWQGDIYERKGEYNLALAHYYETLKLAPNVNMIPMKIVNIHEKQEKYCLAYQELKRYSRLFPELNERHDIKYMFKKYNSRGQCKQSLSQGNISIKSQNGVFIANVLLNGSVKGTFLVDTGASLVTLGNKIAREINHRTTGKTVPMMTVNGIASGELSRLDSILVNGGAGTDGLLILISKLETFGNGIDGLLGMNFLSRFNLIIDSDSKVLRLEQINIPE